eukprot:Nk52_evm19s675 gene=Nk52_evmTU19s675
MESILFDNAGITNIPGNFLKSCTKLSQVTIQNNAKLTKLPSGFLTYSEVLSKVKITSNGITSLESNLIKLGDLSSFSSSLSNNQQNCLIDFSNNEISSVTYPVTVPVTYSTEADCSIKFDHNRLSGQFEPERAFPLTSVKSVIELSLAHNSLTGIGTFESDTFRKSNSGIEYSFSNNQITNISNLEQSILGNCQLESNICSLDFSNNQIANIPNWIYLGYYALQLGSNPITSLEPVEETYNFVSSLNLSHTPKLNFLPQTFLQRFEVSTRILLGDHLSCCSIGKDNLGFLENSISNIKCLYDGEQMDYKLAVLTYNLHSESYCSCNGNHTSCAENTTTNSVVCEDGTVGKGYSFCQCENLGECYSFREISGDAGQPGTGGDSDSDSFTSSILFYVVVIGGAIIVAGCIIGTLLWYFKTQKEKTKATEEGRTREETSGDVLLSPGVESGAQMGNKTKERGQQEMNVGPDEDKCKILICDGDEEFITLEGFNDEAPEIPKRGSKILPPVVGIKDRMVGRLDAHVEQVEVESNKEFSEESGPKKDRQEDFK